MRFSFFLGEALGSMRRNWVMAMAAVITVFISMAILGAVLATRYNLDQGATSLKNRVLIEVFVKDEVNSDNAKVKQLEARIRPCRKVGRRKTVKYVSKDEALQRFEEKFGETITRSLPLNPLPASFEIQVKNPDDVDKVAARFFDDPLVDNDAGTHNGVKDLAQGDGAQDARYHPFGGERHVGGHRDLLGRGHPAHLHHRAAQHLHRRREVEIMRLVGATNWFIRWPFVLEGFITGVLGALLAGFLVWITNWALKNWITASDINFLNLRVYGAWWQSGSTWPLGLVPTLAILGAVLGSVGASWRCAAT